MKINAVGKDLGTFGLAICSRVGSFMYIHACALFRFLQGREGLVLQNMVENNGKFIYYVCCYILYHPTYVNIG